MEEQDIFSTNYTTQGEPVKDLGVGDIFGSSPTRQFAEDLPFTSDTPRTSNVDVAKAQKYIGTDVFDDPDIEERMAKGQSWGSKFGGFVAQSLAEIGGGTLQGFGSIYEIVDNAISEANNGDADFNNLLIQLGTNIQEGAKEQFPIYRENRDKAIDLNDWGWWFENATSLASTLSLLIPAAGTVKGVSYIGKLAGIADKVGDTAKMLGKTGLTAAIMRNGENMRESLDVFNTTKKEALQELSAGDNFNSWILTDAGQEYMNEIGERDVTPENAANWIASKAGWHSYKWNSANIVFDLIQAGTLFRGAGKFTRTNVLGGKTALREAAGLETSLAKKTAKMFNPLVGTFAGQFTEGIEEGINFIGGEEGKYYGKELLNTRPDNKELPERLAGYVADPNLWNSFAWGIAGGAVFQGVSNILTKDARKQQDINKLAEINNRGKLIADAAQTKQLLFNRFKNGEINEDELKDGVSDITDTLGYHLGMTAAKTGNVDILLETLDNPDFQGKIAASYTPDELKNLTISQDELVAQVKEGVLKAEDNYKTFSNYLWASSASQAAKEALITTQMQTASDVLRHENAVKKLTDKYNSLIKEETETNAVTTDTNFNTALDYEGVKLASAILSKSIEQTTFPVNVGEKLKLELDSLNQEKERLKTALNTGGRPDLSTVNPELIETVAALNIRKSYKSVNERILTDLKKKNLVNEIDKEFQDKKEQEDKDNLQKLEQDLSIGLSSGNITEEKFKELDTEWSGNKKAIALINKAKKQFKEQQKAKKIEAERTAPTQVEEKIDEAEQQLEVPVQPLVVEVPDTTELRKQVNQQSPALGTSLLKEVDETNTVDGLQELRDKRLNTRKLKLTEDSAFIKLIDAKIAQLNQANSVETTEQNIPEPIVEETTDEVPSQDEINNEEVIEPNILNARIPNLPEYLSDAINDSVKIAFSYGITLKDVEELNNKNLTASEIAIELKKRYPKLNSYIEEGSDNVKSVQNLVRAIRTKFALKSLDDKREEQNNTQSELDKAKSNFSAAFSAFSKAINNTTSSGVPLSAEVINAGIALLKAGAELGFATVKEIARYAKKEFGGNFTPEFLKGLKGAYAFANATDSLPDGIIANDDSVKELTLDNLEETVVEEPIIVQEAKQEEQIEAPANVGSANLFVAPLAFITDYKSGDKSLGYKTKSENDEEAALIFTGNIQGEVSFVIDSSNPYHKDSIEESAIEVYKDGKRTKMFLNTISSIQKQIDVVNKIIKKFEEGKELTEQYYPELNRKINENEWIKSYWLQELKENLDATKRIRDLVFNNPNNNYVANLSINSPGSIVNTKNEDKTSNWQKVDKALGEDVEIFFTHPEIKGGSLELIGTKGNRIAQRTSASEFHAGRMYVGIKGLNGDTIPARLKVNTISSQDANKVYDLILELADLIQNKNAKLDSREINEIREKFNSILLVNKFNDDATTYFKIHQNRIELTFGEKNENKVNINFRFPIKDKGWVNIKTDGKLDILARFDLGERGVKDVYLVNKTKSEGRDFEKWLKAAISKKLYNVDKKRMLADSDYRNEVIQNRLLTDVGGVYNSKGELLGRTVLKQEGRIENAIFSVNEFKEVNTKEIKQENTSVSGTEGSVPNEVQPSSDTTTTNDNLGDTLLPVVLPVVLDVNTDNIKVETVQPIISNLNTNLIKKIQYPVFGVTQFVINSKKEKILKNIVDGKQNMFIEASTTFSQYNDLNDLKEGDLVQFSTIVDSVIVKITKAPYFIKLNPLIINSLAEKSSTDVKRLEDLIKIQESTNNAIERNLSGTIHMLTPDEIQSLKDNKNKSVKSFEFTYIDNSYTNETGRNVSEQWDRDFIKYAFNTGFEDTLLLAVSEVGGQFETSTLEEKQANWSKMFGENVEFDGNIAELIYAKGQWAYGVFRNAAVEISSKAPRGTEYHEAFHVVSHLYLTGKQYEKVITEKRNTNPDFANKTDIEIEEILANEFHLYSLMRDSGKTYKGVNGTIKKFFDRIYNYIKNLLGYPTDYIFDKIYSGGFNYQPSDRVKNFVKNQKQELLSAVPNDVELSFTRKDIDTFVNVLTRFAGDFYLKNQNLKKEDIISDSQNNVKTYVQSLVTNVADNPTKWNITENQAKELKRRLNYFDEFWNLTKENLDKKLSIEIEYDDSINVTEIGDDLKKDWDDTKAFSRSAKETFSSELKLLIMTTPQIEKFDGDKAVTLKNAEIGIAPALDFNKVYPYLQRAMTGALNVDEMMQRLKTLSQHDMSLLYLKQKLEANPNMKRAWFFNFNKPLVNFHNYQVTTLEDKIKVKFDISNTATSYFKISNNWAEDIKTKIDLGYYTQENKEESRSLLSQLNTAKNNLDINLITEISEKLFNLAGIKLSSDIIKKIISNELNVRYYDTLMGSFKETIEKPLINIIKTLYPDKEGIVKFENYGDLNSIALQYQYYTYEGQENSFANTEGSVMFGFNNPNFLNNFFKSIKAAINPHYNNSVEAKQELLNILKGYASDPSMKYSNWLWDTGNGGFLKLVDGQKDVKGLTVSHINYNFLRNFNLYSFDGVKNRITGDGYRYSSMSDEDWKLTELLDYLSAEQKDHSYINVPVVIQSDSGNSFAIRTNNFQYKSPNDLKQGGFIFEAVKNTVRQEILRMKNASDLMFTRNLDGSLKVKEGLDVSKLQNLYHYKLDKQGNPMLLDSNGYPIGNVFRFQNMILQKDGKFMSLNDIDILFYNGVINLGSGNTLTASQNAELNSFITDFINYEISETKKNFGKFADTLNQMQNERGKELLAVYNNDFDKFITEFAMNHYIANVEQSNFFNGVIAEYKSPTDTNKRAKEITSPIVSGDIEVLGDTYQAVILKDIKLQSNTIDSIIKGLERELKRQNKNYRGMDVEADNIKKKKTTNKLEEQILSIAGGYLSINTTDAQGFITLKRYRAILSSFGRMFQDTINLLDKVERGEQINIDDYQRLLVPLKPFYYGRFYDEYSGRMMSRQVKLSVFPLIDNLVKGTELETLRDYAVANNVDEIYFESAIKVGATDITNIADSNGRLLPDFATKLKPQTLFNKFWGLQLDVVQHTMDTKNKLGIQMAKIIPSGLSINEDYELDGKKVNGDVIKKEWHNVLAAHIEESALDLLKQLKAKKVDDKWTIDSNSKEIKELLLKELKRRNLAQNYSDALEYNRKGEFNLPLFYSAMANKFESLLSSLFKNNVTDLKTAGSHLVLGSTAFLTKVNNQEQEKVVIQMQPDNIEKIINGNKTSTVRSQRQSEQIGLEVGQSAITEFGNKKFIVTNKGNLTINEAGGLEKVLKTEGVQSINDFKYQQTKDWANGQGTLYYYQIEELNLFNQSKLQNNLGIEWTQKVIDRNDFNLKSVQYDNDKTIKAEAIMPRWTKKFFKDGQPININELPEDVRTFVMNRIPTESKHSIIVLEAVGFMPAELDALMIVPDDIVNMMGSDFDVDSGYNWHYNVEAKDGKVQVISYDNSKKAKENSKQARENRLLDLTLAIMLSPYTFIEQLTPSSFDDLTMAKKELQEIRGIDESNINPNSVNGQLRFRSAVIAGRALKGLAASMNGILPVYQDIGAKFKKNEDNTNGFVVKYDKKDLNVDEVKNRYKDDILNEDSNTITILHRYIANSPNNDYLNVNGVNLTGYTSQTLANVLDIVKEGITPNLNTYTFGVFQSLLSVGSNIEYASRFIDQPAINYLFKQVQAGESLLDSTTMSPITRTRNLYQTELFKTMYYMGKYENDKDAMKQFRYLTKVDKNGKVVWDTDKSLFVKEADIESLLGYDPTKPVYFSKSELEANIKYSVTRNKKLANSSKEELQKQADYIVKQLQILDLFSIYRDNANKIGAASRVLSFDKIASSPTLNATPEFELKLANAQSLSIVDKNGNNIVSGVYSENSTYPTLKAYWEFSNKLAFDLFSNLFIKYTPAFSLASNRIARQITKPDEGTFKKIQDYLVSLAMTKIPFFSNLDKKTILGIDAEIKVNDEIEFEEFKNLSTANKVFILKSKNFKLLYNNPNHLLNYLEPKLSNDNIDRTGFHKIEMNKPAPSEGVDDYISDSFRDMYFGSDKFMKNLAEDLIRYSFVTNGLTFGKDSFSNYIPEFVLNSALNLGEELRMIHTKSQDIKYLETEFPEYVDLFFKNNWYNKNIIPRVVTRFKKVDGELVIDEDETEFAGESVYKTVKNTPIWELNGDFLIVKEDQLKGEDRVIQRAEYVLLNQRKGDTIQQILMKRNFDINQGVYYYYPVNKLGNTHINNEFTENSVLPNNNSIIPESQYEFFFERSHMSSWAEASKAFYENQRNKESNNDNINCK